MTARPCWWLQNGRLVALDLGADRGISPSCRPGQEGAASPSALEQALGEGGPVWHSADVDGNAVSEIVVGTGAMHLSLPVSISVNWSGEWLSFAGERDYRPHH